MEIKKAIITAAGKTQRSLPLQTLVDRDGVQKTALAIVIEEVLKAGVEDICVVVHPGDAPAFAAASGRHSPALHFVEQTIPLGYGHAVYSARDFIENEPFLLLVGDHLYLSQDQKSCAQQLVEVARAESCAVSAVQATHESKLPYYGAVGGHLLLGKSWIYQIDNVLEKPTPTEAEQKLVVPGLRAGHYLCFFGMHVLTPAVMRMLGEMVQASGENSLLHLSPALLRLASQERYLAYEVRGRRFDIGVQYGLLTAQLALALDGKDRDEVLNNLLELLATTRKDTR